MGFWRQSCQLLNTISTDLFVIFLELFLLAASTPNDQWHLFAATGRRNYWGIGSRTTGGTAGHSHFKVPARKINILFPTNYRSFLSRRPAGMPLSVQSNFQSLRPSSMSIGLSQPQLTESNFAVNRELENFRNRIVPNASVQQFNDTIDHILVGGNGQRKTGIPLDNLRSYSGRIPTRGGRPLSPHCQPSRICQPSEIDAPGCTGHQGQQVSSFF